MISFSELKFLTTAFEARFWRSERTILTLFSGHLPWDLPNSLAYPVLPTPPLNLVNGTHLLC